MTQDLSLHQRRRPPSAAELDGIPWLAALQPHEREQATAALLVGDAMVGDYVCRMGRPVTYWFGVVEGLLKMNSSNAEGDTMTFAGLPPGGWFGEGTVIRSASTALSCTSSTSGWVNSLVRVKLTVWPTPICA